MSDSDSLSDDGVDFSAIDSQAHASMTIEEANKLNRQKLTAIMRSNDKLKKEVRQLKKEGSDNYRVKQIKNLRQQLRETQSIADGITKTLMAKTGMGQEEVGEMYDEILSQPKLAKPNNPVKLKKDVLVLQQQMQATERELAATKRLLREYRSGERRPEDPSDGPLSPGVVRRSNAAGGQQSDSAIAAELRQLRLDHDVARGEIDTKTRVIALHRDMCSKLQAENRELRQLKLEWDLMAQAKQAAELEARRTREEMGRTAGHQEEHAQDVRELRTKLAAIMSVREKVEQGHAARVQSMAIQIAKVQERESHLLTQMNILKTDLHTSTEALAWYKAELAKAKAATTTKQTESEKVWELQTKLTVVQKELREKSLDLKALQSSQRRPTSGSGGDAALHDRIKELQYDNQRLAQQMDVVERKYIVHHESRHGQDQALEALQQKYTIALRDADESHSRLKSESEASQSLRQRVADLEARLDAGAKQWARAQQEQAERKAEWERQERLVHQLRSELQARGSSSAGGDSAPQLGRQPSSSSGSLSGGPSTSRSESTDSLFSSRESSDVKKALKKADETHLEHVAKLMRNFEQRERDLLYQLARLQEQIKPGSGNRTHLTYGAKAKLPTATIQPAASAAKQFNLDSSDEESEDDSEDDL